MKYLRTIVVFTLAVVAAACGDEKAPAPSISSEEASIQMIKRSLAHSLDRSSDGLVVVPVAGGGERVDTQGRFQSAVLAKIGPDGRVVVDCVDSVESAEAFLRAPAPAPAETRSDR